MRIDKLVLSFALATVIVAFADAHAEPRVVLILLDGATPRLVREFMRDGTISDDKGLGLLARRGATADYNITVHPSLAAPAHIAIAPTILHILNVRPAATVQGRGLNLCERGRNDHDSDRNDDSHSRRER